MSPPMSLDEIAAASGYVHPPDHVRPEILDDAGLDALAAWFEEVSRDPAGALLVYVAREKGWTIPQAYVWTDGWAKGRARRAAREEGYETGYN